MEAEVIQWVYNAGSEEPSPRPRTDTLETATYQAGGFFSRFFSSQSDMFKEPSTPAPIVPKEPIKVFKAISSNISLTIFAANVEARLDDKMTGELLRSTLKKPPSRLRYELIYVSTTVV